MSNGSLGNTPAPPELAVTYGTTRQRSAWYPVVGGVVLDAPCRSQAQACKAACKAAAWLARR